MQQNISVGQQQQQAFTNYYEQQPSSSNNNIITSSSSSFNSNINNNNNNNSNRMNQKEIYTYNSDWMIYSLSWSVRRDEKYRLAIGSFIEEYRNKVDIIKLNNDNILERVAQFEHPYPATKIQFHPSASINNPDLIATSGDYLRLWNINNNSTTTTTTTSNNNVNNNISSQQQQQTVQTVQKYHTFNNDSSSEFCAPLTSFDWCEYNPNMIGTCSIDTTCTIWDIPTGKSKTQLVAHDKEVYDISFKDENIFCTIIFNSINEIIRSF
ncbi:predicted protein [Naegleria gruberi]|uniref:Predicted protein n=1 Tax=Naegleria gruberi TaxID=5762 RepID=D2W5P7_NAEGR|nr:uncharacterized protein NAEGRDRAFT_76739 [Naegleria gruberi]EFC35605.1 predicted protein [Naegleria gruberi]|eukprot:XP_002668349.1 predicted protein [Naegleria gruberi strain NEG-M]